MGGCLGLEGKETQQSEGESKTGGSGMEIKGSVAIITGAAQGLGRAFAETLLARGAKVCVADIDTEQGPATVEELKALHGQDSVTFVSCDVTKDEDFKGTWDATVERMGPVNLLINNAGIGNEQKWQLAVDVNMGGCMRGTLLALERMGTNKGGAGGVVVNLSSIAGLKVVPFGPVYAATKHAIVGLTRSLGHEFHHKINGVKIQALCPSLVKTELLANSIKNAFSPEVAQALTKFSSNLKEMTAEYVASGLVKLLEEGRNGACMVVEADKEPYYVEAPIPS